MFTDPIKNLRAFGLGENMIVADLGAGSGHYSIPIAKMVSKGKVYAIEIQKDFLTTIKNKAAEAHVNNIEFLLGNVEKKGGTKLKDSIVDAVVASNILFQVEDKNGFIEEIKRILKPGGKVILIDWSSSVSSMPINFESIVSRNKAREMFEEKGFVYKQEIDAGSYHYGIILSKS